MIDRDHTHTVTRQAALLGISRGSVYLPASSRLQSRPGADALDRRTASGACLHGRTELRRQLRQACLKVGRQFTEVVLALGCKLSMDGHGSWRNNVFVERVWRSVQYEWVYPKAYDSVSAAHADIAEYLDWYIHRQITFESG